MKITAQSAPNIALIKYWGNRNDEWRLPAADSLSMTLDSPTVDITIEHAHKLSVTSNNKEMTEKDLARFQKTIELMKQYLQQLKKDQLFPFSLAITIDSKVPSGIGLASSAAVFSALAKSVAKMADEDMKQRDVSVLARLGSGSASRSMLGGFVAMKNIGDGMNGAVAEQIAPADHWKLYDIVIAPNIEQKKVGSTEGHAQAHTSPHFAERLKAIVEYRMQECIEAIHSKDFEKLQNISEQDALDMHHCMETQNPPLQYLSDETYRIIDEVKALRTAQHLPVLFTMDAGPTVHLICEESAKASILSFANAQKGCKVFEASVGKGAHLV